MLNYNKTAFTKEESLKKVLINKNFEKKTIFK